MESQPFIINSNGEVDETNLEQMSKYKWGLHRQTSRRGRGLVLSLNGKCNMDVNVPLSALLPGYFHSLKTYTITPNRIRVSAPWGFPSTDWRSTSSTSTSISHSE